MIKVNLKHCGKFKNIQAHKILYWLLENNREQDLANEGQQLYLNSMIASALSLTVFNQGAIPLPLIHMKQHLCFTVARVPLWPMLPYKINALYCNALGFYSRWIFISTQHTTVKYNWQLSKHSRTIPHMAIDPLAHQVALEMLTVLNNTTRANSVHNPF
jgi:hypothetical protein